MRYFLDTEFDDNGRTIELISVALVSQDDRELYAVSDEFSVELCNDWVRANVLPQLPPRNQRTLDGATRWASRRLITQRVREFIGDDPAPEFWAYYADYDWVVFCQLFGPMSALPPGYPQMCMDLKQLAFHKYHRGDLKKLLPMTVGEHDALADARWNRDLYDRISDAPYIRRPSSSWRPL